MISTWLSYSFADLIMFSQESYQALISGYNQDIWPMQVLFFLLSIAILFFLFQKKEKFPPKLIGMILVLCWIWCGQVYQWSYFQPINWLAKYFTLLFLVQAALIAITLLRGLIKFDRRMGPLRIIGLLMFIASAFLPLRLFVTGEWDQVLLFGWGAQSTAVGTLGLLLLCRFRPLQIFLYVIPALWLFISLMTDIYI